MKHPIFSERQYEVLQLLMAGRSRRQIAYDLRLSPNSIKKLITEILIKTQTTNRVELFRYAWTNGLIRPRPSPAETVTDLTNQQRHILSVLWQYPSQDLLATHLGVSTKCVNYHIGCLYKKTGTHTITALLRYAAEQGLANPEPLPELLVER